MPTRCAISSTALDDATPSTVFDICLRASAIEPVRPINSPNVRLRESGEPQLATRSPIPARPAADSGSDPCAAQRRATSLSPRVMSIA